MLVLGIESSAGPASAAVVQDGQLLGEFFVHTKQTHSQTLLPMVEALLESLSLSCGDLERIAVANGPGSFTGVRIGVACVKGIAFPLELPCCGVSTLEAIAFGALGCEGNILCATMDARCGQVYNALFQAEQGRLERLTADRAVSIRELGEECKKYGERLLLLGDGALLCHKEFAVWGAKLAPERIRFQHAASVAFLGAQGDAVSAEELLPAYLRLPQAERELRAKQEKGQGKDG